MEYDAYYYTWNQGAWICFATEVRASLVEGPSPQSHPLLGCQQEEKPTVKGYRTQTKVVDNVRFLKVTKSKFLRYRRAVGLEAAILKFFQQLARWRRNLICFIAASEEFYTILDVVAACKELTGSDRLFIGLYNKYNRSLTFELPEKQNDDYYNRVITISEKENPNTYRELISEKQDHSFWMPSKFGPEHYRAYKLYQRRSFLGVSLIGEENPTATAPYVDNDKLRQALELVLADLRLRRWHEGRKLLEALFEVRFSPHPAEFEEHLKNFSRGARLPSLDRLCAEIRDKLKTTACTIYWKKGTAHLVLAGSTHNLETRSHSYEINRPSLTTECFNSGEPICLFDVSTDPRNTHGFDVQVSSSERHKSWLAYPVTLEDQPIGVLRVLHKINQSGQVTYFTGTDIENSRLISNYIAHHYQELSHTASLYEAKEQAQSSSRTADIERNRTARIIKSLTHEIEKPIPAIGYLLEYLGNLIDKSSIPNADQLSLSIKDSQAGLNLLQLIVNTITQYGDVIVPTQQEAKLVQGLLEPLHNMLGHYAKTKKKTFIYANRSSRIWVKLDAALTTQLLVILLLNAFKYSATGSTILMNVQDTDDGIEFEVEDQGEVIPPGDTERIFEWEYRAPDIRRQNYPGAGIGLTIARKITDALRTKVYLKKRTPKTIFAFELKVGDPL
jgi:signal transduction histidine kinase